MGYSYAYEFEEALELGLLPTLFSSLPSMAFQIVSYVLTALAIYAIAKRRGLKNPWLAWIPVADVWLLGSISDQYRYVVKREVKSKRKVLLVLSILSAVCSIVIVCLGVSVAVKAISGALRAVSEEQLVSQVLGPVIGILGLCVPLVGVGIAYAIIRYMALYDVFKSLDPGNSVMYLVLSIIFGVTEPFFLFFNRNKDNGMPPRKQEPVYEQPVYEQPVYQQPPEESWNNSGPDYL